MRYGKGQTREESALHDPTQSGVIPPSYHAVISMNSKDAFDLFAHLVTRRGFLSKGLAAGLAATLAGCSKSDKTASVSAGGMPAAPPPVRPRPVVSPAPAATAPTTPAPPPRPRATVPIPPHSLAVSKDGALLMVCQNGAVHAWSITKRQPLDLPGARQLQGVQTLALAPDKRLACASGRSIALISESGRYYRTLMIPAAEGEVRSLTFTPDGRRLVSGSADGTLRLWPMPDGEKPQYLGTVNSAVNAVVVTRDGQWLLSGSGADKGEVTLWSLPSGKQQGSLSGHEQTVTQLAVSPNGMYLASAAGTRLRIWPLPFAAQPHAVIDCGSHIYYIGFLRGNKMVGAVVGDGQIHNWVLPKGADFPPIAKPKQPLLAFAAVPGPKEQVVVAVDMHGTAWLGDADKNIWQELEQTHKGSM